MADLSEASDTKLAAALRSHRQKLEEAKIELVRRGYIVDARGVDVKISRKVTEAI